MGWITSFFTWLWDSVKNTVSFVASVYAQLVVAFTSIVSAVVSFKTSISDGSTFVQNVNTLGSSVTSSISSFFNSSNETISVCIHVLSLDILFSTLLSFATVSLAILVAVVTFVVVSVPLYIASIYLVKASAWALVAILPSGWCPQGLLRLTNLRSSLAKSVFDGFTKVFVT